MHKSILKYYNCAQSLTFAWFTVANEETHLKKKNTICKRSSINQKYIFKDRFCGLPILLV